MIMFMILIIFTSFIHDITRVFKIENRRNIYVNPGIFTI